MPFSSAVYHYARRQNSSESIDESKGAWSEPVKNNGCKCTFRSPQPQHVVARPADEPLEPIQARQRWTST